MFLDVTRVEFRKRAVLSVLSLLIVFAASGCGEGRAKDAPEVAPVSGTVTFKGEPLKNAQVLFLPDTPAKPSASGSTDDSGRYTLTTQNPGDGALVGKHKVAITARGPDKVLPENQMTTGLPGSNIAPGDPLIPAKFFNPGTSGLTADVPAEGKTDMDFKLD